MVWWGRGFQRLSDHPTSSADGVYGTLILRNIKKEHFNAQNASFVCGAGLTHLRTRCRLSQVLTSRSSPENETVMFLSVSLASSHLILPVRSMSAFMLESISVKISWK